MNTRPPSGRSLSLILLAASFLACPAQEAPAAPEPPRVGERGFISRVEFDGNQAFSDVTLRGALAKDMSVLLASHPAAELSKFLTALSRQVTAGYQHEGFPDATAEAVVAAHASDAPIVVRIHEGPRFVMGDIRIEGARDLNPDRLREKLMGKSDEVPDRALASEIRRIMASYAAALPPIESDGTADAPANEDKPAGDLTNTFKPSILNRSSTPSEADWTPGEPLSFCQSDEATLIDKVREHLATFGRPLAVAHTAKVRRDDGRADLIVRIDDEGPPAVTGRIRVFGCSSHTAEEISTAAGLTGGQGFTPGLIDNALVALWNSGRFFPFAITPQPRGKDAREIDISIQVREIPQAPHLNAKLAPEVEAAQRFIRTLNEWGSSENGNDIVVSDSDSSGLKFLVGLSNHAGMLVKVSDPEKGLRFSASFSDDGLRVNLTNRDGDKLIRLPLPLDKVMAEIRILPDIGEGEQTLSISATAGISSLENRQGRPLIQFTVTPAMPFIKPEHFRRDGEGFVDYVGQKETWFRLDMATGLPVDSDTARVRFPRGMVAELQGAVAKVAEPTDDAAGLHAWLDAAASYLPMIAEGLGFPPQDQQRMDRWLRLGSALAKPSILRPFAPIWNKWLAAPEAGTSFSIPPDADTAKEIAGSGNVDLLVGLGAVSLSESLAPPDSWVSKFSRELLFIQCGSTRHTADTMERLLADPSMGPIGCFMAAQLLTGEQAPIAQRFLRKAHAEASAEGFRHDWRLLLDSPVGLGGAVEEVLIAMAAIPAEQEQEISELLDPAQARWLHGFLTHLRKRPASDDFASWIAPQMDMLWNDVLGDEFRKRLEPQLKLPPDPKEVIAVVNGQALPRVWITTFTKVFPGSIEEIMPSFEPDPTRPWTRDPTLAAFIRLTLLSPWMKSADPKKLEQLALQLTEAKAAQIEGDTDADWIAACGMTRRQLGLMIAAASQVGQLRKSLPEPDVETVETWWKQNAERLGRSAHLHTLRMKVPGNTAADATFATSLVRESSELLREGLPFITLMAASQLDEGSDLTVSCSKETLLMDLRPEAFRQVISLRPGELSAVTTLGDMRWTAILESWQDSPAPEFGKIRDQATTAWKDEQFRILIGDQLAGMEKSAVIELLPPPAEPESDGTETGFERFLKTSPLSHAARLGVFWQLVLKKDPAAADALDDLMSGKSLGTIALRELAKALDARGLPELAKRCRVEP